MFDSWFQFKLFQSGETTFPLGISPPLCMIYPPVAQVGMYGYFYSGSTPLVLIAFAKTRA